MRGVTDQRQPLADVGFAPREGGFDVTNRRRFTLRQADPAMAADLRELVPEMTDDLP